MGAASIVVEYDELVIPLAPAEGLRPRWPPVRFGIQGYYRWAGKMLIMHHPPVAGVSRYAIVFCMYATISAAPQRTPAAGS